MGCHTLSTRPSLSPRLWPAIPEICPPGEGMFRLGIAVHLLMSRGWEDASQGLSGRRGR